MIVPLLVSARLNFGAKCGGNFPVALDGFFVVEISVANPINVGGRAPAMQGRLPLVNSMRRRSIPAIRADEYRRVHFSPEIFEVTRQGENRARHVVRKSVQ